MRGLRYRSLADCWCREVKILDTKQEFGLALGETAIMTTIAAAEPSGTALAWPILHERARAYAEAARAPATLRAATDWRAFSIWCAAHAVDALPASPQTVALFLADLPGRPATLRRKLAAVAVMHRAAGHDPPTAHGVVRATLAGICRERGIAPRPKTALLVGELRSALATCGDRPIDVRDRALLLIGFAGALRRSELVGLDVGDVRFEAEGAVLRLRRSKTNQEGALEEVAVLYGSDPQTCPVRALQAWLATSGLVTGPLFRAVDRAGRIGVGRLTARIVGERLKKIGERSGLDPQSYAAHSLRSGFATSAARANKSEAAIMRQGRWKSIPVARRYIRAGSRWHDHAGAGIGL
jgi:integrase